MRQPFLHADDVGLNHEVNQATWSLYKRGLLASMSILVNSPAFAEALLLFKKISLPIFLHFNLIEGQPISQATTIPSLVDQAGHFYSARQLISKFMLRQIDKAHILKELEAQLKLLTQSGLHVSGIDSHQHLHALSPVAEAVTQITMKHNLRYLRTYNQMKVFTYQGRLKMFLLQTLALLTHLVTFKELRLPSTWQREQWQSFVVGSWEPIEEKAVPSSILLVCHPGLTYDHRPI